MTTSEELAQKYPRETAQEWLILLASEAICRAMQANEVSKAELARRLGTTRAVVTRNLSGSQNMTLRTFADMATVLGKEVRVTLVARKVVGQKTVGAEVA